MTQNPLLLALVPAVFITTSCATSPHEPNETYILVTANTKIPYWQDALAGLNRAGAELKVKVRMTGPETYDPKAERDAFLNAVQQKPTGILISVTDASLLSTDIDNALHQEVPVITIDADAPDSGRLLFIGTDNYNAGRLGGQLIVKLLDGKGNVVMFSYPNQTNLMDRQNGYESVFGAYPAIKVMPAVNIKGDPTVAFDTAKQLLEGKAKVDAFVCLEAVACPEVGEVVNRANLGGKIKIVAMDTDQRTINWIQKGVISATIAQKPFTMAYWGTKLLDDIHHHPPGPLTESFARNSFARLPTFVDTGTFIVDQGNASSLVQQNQGR
jgi:ribose transport system substrate-binding protein